MAEFFEQIKPVVLVIMDGVGIAPPGPGNAVTLADTPNLDKLWPKYPHGSLLASGQYVGLSQGVDGNSEVGHTTIGCGKAILQDIPRIDQMIQSGAFRNNAVLLEGIRYAIENKSNIHVMGLVSYGKVHSSIEHLYSLLDLVAGAGIEPENLLVHAFLDGRDSSPTAGVGLLDQVEKKLQSLRMGRIASFVGRYYAMDRDLRWERTKIAYDLISQAKGAKVIDFRRELKKQYQKGVTDEYIPASFIPDYKGNIHQVKEKDVIINFNVRADRAIQITCAFERDDFAGFQREKINNLFYIGFTDYKKGFPSHIAFPPEQIKDNLGEVLSARHIRQLRLAESEKFPHVTYFFDGGRQVLYPGETQIEVPSPKNVATYDQTPGMSTDKIVEVFQKQIDGDAFDVAILNFAPTDMVSHTGVLDSAIKAMESVDGAIGAVVDKVLKKKGAVLITADHGNCEELINLRTGEVDTKHSDNPVPFLAVCDKFQKKELQLGTLADVAPTVLYLLGIDKPVTMTGRNLL